MSELFREASRTYSAQQARRTLDESKRVCNTKGYTGPDVPRLIKEVRAENPRRRKVRPLQAIVVIDNNVWRIEHGSFYREMRNPVKVAHTSEGCVGHLFCYYLSFVF